jgi:hypothetical protein
MWHSARHEFHIELNQQAVLSYALCINNSSLSYTRRISGINAFLLYILLLNPNIMFNENQYNGLPTFWLLKANSLPVKHLRTIE